MKILNKFKYYILSFIVPLFICMLILYFKGIFNDVEEFFVSDLRLQHISFLNYLKNIFLGKASIYYSFNAGMGSSMLSTLVFYCISPVNLLLFLMKNIQYAIVWIYVIKICLSGLTMFILLKNKFNSNNNIVTIMFSTCYSLCSFVVGYFFCGFWLDSLYLAPLVTLGIDKMFRDEKINSLYISSLSLAIICNIQMGFGLCIYSLIYYLYCYKLKYDVKKDIKKFKRFGMIFLISSLCVVFISSGILFTFISRYGDISLAREGNLDVSSNVSNIGYIFKNLLSVGNLRSDYYNEFEPLIYSGLIVSCFSVLYFFNRDIEKRKRLCSLTVVLIFLSSFCISFVNMFWHLSLPVMLNFRYSLYLSLFLVIIGYESYITKNKLSSLDISILGILLVLGCLMVLVYGNDIYIVYTVIFLILILLFVWLSKNKSNKFSILLYIVILFEVFMNGYLSIYTSMDHSSVKYGSYDKLLELGIKNDFDDGYRVMYNYSYTDYTNDNLLLNNNSSLRYFSSVIDGDIINFFSRNLIGRGVNSYIVSAYDSPLLLSLLGNKYFYLTEDIYNSIYNKIDEYIIEDVYDYTIGKNVNKNVYLYENPYALPLGYVIESDVSYKDGMNLVDYQNAIIKSFAGNSNNVLIKLDYGVDNNSKKCQSRNFFDCKTYIVNNPTDNLNMYVYALYDEFDAGNVRSYMDNGMPFMISTFDKQISVTLGYSSKLYDDNFMVVTYDKNSLVNSLTSLQEDMLENIKIDGNKMSGYIDSSKDGILFLSIPYEDNFKIYIDNKEVEYFSLLDNSFIGLNINKGIHNIEVVYVDTNFKWYIVCSVLSIFISIGVCSYVNKIIVKRKKEEIIELEYLEEKKNKNKIKKKNKNRKR